jgi:hypothetical protein
MIKVCIASKSNIGILPLIWVEDFTNTFHKASLNYENVLVLGDLNYNMQDGEKSSPLQSVCDIFNYQHIDCIC